MKIPEIKIKVSFDKVKKSELFHVCDSKTMYQAAKEVFNADTINWTEEMILFCLNRKNDIVGFYKVSSGGFSGTVTDPRVILTIALNCCASNLILCHNHPSGNLKPSDSDIKVTEQIKAAAKLLDINILDHLIISDEGYHSMSDQGNI